MLYTGTCHWCAHNGLLGYWLCGDRKTIVLLCDECEMTYLSPAAWDDDRPVRVGPGPDFETEIPGTSLRGGRWAMWAEVADQGWEGRIAGEYHGSDG